MFPWEILLNLVSEFGDGQSLEPDPPGPCERGEKDSVATEDQISDSGDTLNLESHAGLKCSDVARMNAKELAGSKVFDDEFAREFEPGDSLPTDFLQNKTAAAEDSCAKGLLKAEAELDARGCA